MSAERLETPERVLGMRTVDVVGFARHAGKLAIAMGADIPRGVEAGNVAEHAASALPVVMAIRRGEYVDPAVIQGHVDFATDLGERMRGSRMPGGFLNFVNEALANAKGAKPNEIADRIREGLERASANGSLDTIEPFLRIAEQFDAGTQLTGELTSMAHYIQELAVYRNGKGKIDPKILAGAIHESAGDVVSGRAPFPLMQQVLRVYMGTSGKQVALPPFEGGVATKLTAAAPAIMEAVNAALPPEQRDPAFLDRMRTSFVGKVGGAVGNGSLKAIEQDVTPLLTHLRGMLSGNPAETRRELSILLTGSPA